MISITVVDQMGIAGSGEAFDAEGKLARPQDVQGLQGLAASLAGAAA